MDKAKKDRPLPISRKVGRALRARRRTVDISLLRGLARLAGLTATSRLRKAVTSHRTPKAIFGQDVECGDLSPLWPRVTCHPTARSESAPYLRLNLPLRRSYSRGSAITGKPIFTSTNHATECKS